MFVLAEDAKSLRTPVFMTFIYANIFGIPIRISKT